MNLRGIIALGLALLCTPVAAQVNPGTSPLSIPKGGTGGATAAAARNNIFPTPSLSGDSIFWNGSNWVIQSARTTITASVTASVNDYTPAGYSVLTGWLRLTSTGTWNITGIVAQTPGDILLVTNVGTSNKVTLNNNSGSSSAANRMTLGNDVVLGPAQTQCLVYDSSSVWRPCSAASGFGGPLFINGVQTLNYDGTYAILSTDNGNHIICGHASDPTCYHRQTAFIFQSLAAFPFVQIDSTGFQIFGGTSGSTKQVVAGTASGTWTWPSTTDTVVGRQTPDTLTNKTIDAGTFTTSFTATNLVGNAALAQMAANRFKANNTGGTANAADITVAQAQTMLLGAVQLGKLTSANFNSTADQNITITSPSATGYMIDFVLVTNASASISTAVGGIYTGASKTGAQALAAGSTYPVTATTVNTAANSTANGGTRIWLNSATLFFSLTTPQGSAATADIYVFGRPLY